MDRNHDIVPTLRMMDGVYTGLAADEIERLRTRVASLERVVDTAAIPGSLPTHRCKVCGAYWRKWNIGGKLSWNLCSRGCGECCDNAAMGDQIEALTSPAKVGGDEPDGEYHAVARALGDIPCDDFKPEHMTVLHQAIALLDRAALSADDACIPPRETKVGEDGREAYRSDMIAAGAKDLGNGTWEWDGGDFLFQLWRQARAALSADGGEDKRDAERYRVIRNCPTTVMRYGEYLSGQALDAQCDTIAASKAAEERKS